MSYATFHPPNNYISKNLAAAPAPPPGPPPQAPSFTPIVQPRELPRQRLPESFNLVNPLPTAFSLPSDSPVSLYRARMDNRNVVLRVLNGENPPRYLDSFPRLPVCVTAPFPSARLQIRPTPPRDTASSTLHPSWPSWARIPSCRNSSAWFRCGLRW